MRFLKGINPFIKLGLAAGVSCVSWLGKGAVAAGVAAAIVCAAILILRIPRVRDYFRIILLVGVLVTLSWTLNFVLRGVPVASALEQSLRFALRLVATTGSFFIVIETTSAGALMAACSRLGLPSSVTLVLVLVIGMIPLLRDEYHQIGDTQRARDLELDRGPIVKRVLHTLARGIPLMVQSYRAAESITLSLALHGFDIRQRRTTWRRFGWVMMESDFPVAPESAPHGAKPP